MLNMRRVAWSAPSLISDPVNVWRGPPGPAGHVYLFYLPFVLLLCSILQPRHQLRRPPQKPPLPAAIKRSAFAAA